MSVKPIWSIGSTPEDMFHSLTTYLNGRHLKTVARSKPSYIRVEIGSWFSFVYEGNAKGELEAKIMKVDSGSRICLNFNFAKEYSLGLFAAFLGTLPFLMIGAVLNSILIGFLGGVAISAIVIVSEVYSVSNTKRKVLEEFDTLMQLLASS